MQVRKRKEDDERKRSLNASDYLGSTTPSLTGNFIKVCTCVCFRHANNVSDKHLVAHQHEQRWAQLKQMNAG